MTASGENHRSHSNVTVYSVSEEDLDKKMSVPASPVEELESKYAHLRPVYEIFQAISDRRAFVGNCVLSDGTCARLLSPGAPTKKQAKAALALMILTQLASRPAVEFCRAKITSINAHGVKAKIINGTGAITFHGVLSEHMACVDTELIIMHAPTAQAALKI
jgi:hypothetical protein